MMRLPHFRYLAPRSLEEAAKLLASNPNETMLLAGDRRPPNMKRRQQTPKTLLALRRVPELRAISNGTGLTLGSGLTLTELVREPRVAKRYGALWQAAAQIATPHLRNMGTIGGNLCLDTRCNYYDQNYEWRKAIDFCMKKDGDICWVATSSPKCLAVSSTDTAPALMALGAKVRLVSERGTRDVWVSDLYQNDGIHYLTRRADEILSQVWLPPAEGWKSCYWKLRRRGSFDFPVLSVAAALKIDKGGIVEQASVVLGAVASRPLAAAKANADLVGKKLDDEAIARAADLASEVARPMDNTDFLLGWRKKVARDFVGFALRELRGDDMRAIRQRYARQSLEAVS